MPKFITFFIILLFICFLTPNLFLIDVINFDKPNFEKVEDNVESNEDVENYNSGDAVNEFVNSVKNIKLYLTESNKTIDLELDEYIKGVLIGEMPVDYEIEALKAQAIVARTYTLNKLKNNPNCHENADMCDDINCCQCYKTKEDAFIAWEDDKEIAKWDKIEEAVESTKGSYITFNNELISAFFHSHSGGRTEDVRNVWGGEEVSYLKSVSGEESDLFNDSKTYTKAEFDKLLSDNLKGYDAKNVNIEVIDKTESGRVNNVKIGEVSIKATELRKILGIRSTNFTVSERENGDVTFNTIGYGHGVGMSQQGANNMALQGKKADEIIKHYYTGVEVK